MLQINRYLALTHVIMLAHELEGLHPQHPFPLYIIWSICPWVRSGYVSPRCVISLMFLLVYYPPGSLPTNVDKTSPPWSPLDTEEHPPPIPPQQFSHEDILLLPKLSESMELQEDGRDTPPPQPPKISEEDMALPPLPPKMNEEDMDLPPLPPKMNEEDMALPPLPPKTDLEETTVPPLPPKTMKKDGVLPPHPSKTNKTLPTPRTVNQEDATLSLYSPKAKQDDATLLSHPAKKNREGTALPQHPTKQTIVRSHFRVQSKYVIGFLQDDKYWYAQWTTTRGGATELLDSPVQIHIQKLWV